MPADAKTQEIIEVSGGVSRLIRQDVLKTFRTTDLVEMLRQTAGMDSGILPYNCVGVKEGKFKGSSGHAGSFYHLYVCLERPRITTIRFKGNDVDESEERSQHKMRTFALAMPWMATFILFINEALSTVVLSSIMEPEGLWPDQERTQLFVTPLPNLEHGIFCLGQLRLDSAAPHWARANHVMRYIQESVWNNDLYPQFGSGEEGCSPSVRGFKDWAQKTEEHGQAYWRELNLKRMGLTLGDELGELTNGRA